MLRRIIFLFLFFILNAVLISSGQVQSSKEDQMVDDLLKQMTIEEKIGQMTQVTAEVVAKTKGDGKTPYQLDPEKLKEAVVDYKVGSILNVWDVALTVDQWHDMITNIQDLALNENRLKIPVIYGIDAIHGANYTLDATLFPQSIAMAATWDRNLVRKCAEITALEVRALNWGSVQERLSGAGPRGIALCLDRVTDPHNVGAILRSAEVFGARAVIAPRRRTRQIRDAS